MRAFVKLRETLSLHRRLSGKLHQLELKVAGHDEDIKAIFRAIEELMEPPPKPPREIGFRRT